MTIKNKKMKGLGIAFIGAILILLIMVWFDKITMAEAKDFGQWITTFALGLGFFAAKDHDKDNNEDVTG